jgi:hypothetical protein
MPNPTLFALDKVTHARYEVATELRWNQYRGVAWGRQEVGIYLGRRKGIEQPAFLVVMLGKEPPVEKTPLTLSVWSYYFDEGGQERAQLERHMCLMPHSPIVGPNAEDASHHLRIQVLGERVAVFLDREPQPSFQFDIATLRRKFPIPVTAHLDAHGQLGVWVRNGSGCFREMTVTLLSPEPK